MKLLSMLNRIRNVQTGGTKSTPSTPYAPYMPAKRSLEIVLTFDDGPASTTPSGENRTQDVMKELESRRIPGVFFVQTHAPIRGGSADGRRIIGDIHNRGHLLGLHTTVAENNPHHPNFYHTKLQERGELRTSLQNGKDLIEQVTATEVEFVRPPAGVGANDSDVIQTYEDLDLELVMWDSDPERGARRNKERILANIKSQIDTYLANERTEMVVLLHDVQRVVADNLPSFIDKIEEVACDNGYEPVWELTAEEVKQVMRNQNNENEVRRTQNNEN